MNIINNNKRNCIKKDLAIIVMSYKYTDLWKIFFKLFYKFWVDCPFKVYFFSNHVENKDISYLPRVKNILIKDALSWSELLKRGLNCVNEKYILLLVDDFFLLDFVNTNKILEIFSWALKNNINYLRMNPSPKPDKNYNELVGIISKGAIYRTSSTMPIWKKKTLLNLLKIGESAWEFEIHGSTRSDNYNGFFSTWGKYFSFINGVILGVWQRDAVRKLKFLGIKVDLNKRKVMTLKETIAFYFKRKRRALLYLFPAKYRREIRNKFLKNKYRNKK